MKQSLLRTAAGWIAAVVLFCISVHAAPSLSARHAILMDGATGRVLYEKNADSRALIASTTKIMTALLVIEECDLKAEVSVPKEAVGTEGSSMYLKEQEVLSVEALLYGLMLHSGNDAAVTLAMYCSGSVEAFVEKMNRKAESLQLTGTHFQNPHGLDSDAHYSTARDLARLAAYAMENPVFHQIVSTKTVTVGERNLTNHNRLLWRYEGAVGLKTGYTQNAGRILVSAAERDGRRLIVVTIDAPDDWNDHVKLLDHGFSAYESREIVKAGEILGSVPVIGGAEPSVDVVTGGGISYPLTREEQVVFRLDLPCFVYSPVLAGESAGKLAILVDGVQVISVPLYWRYSVLEEA